MCNVILQVVQIYNKLLEINYKFNGYKPLKMWNFTIITKLKLNDIKKLQMVTEKQFVHTFEENKEIYPNRTFIYKCLMG